MGTKAKSHVILAAPALCFLISHRCDRAGKEGEAKRICRVKEALRVFLEVDMAVHVVVPDWLIGAIVSA